MPRWEWLDGPGLCAWLEQQGIILRCKRGYEWRRGMSANVYTADRYLTQQDIHLSQLPDWLWKETSGECEVDMAEVELACVASLTRGDRPSQIANRWDLTADQVRRWGYDHGVEIRSIDNLHADKDRERKRKKVAA